MKRVDLSDDSGVVATPTGEAEDAEEASRHEGVGGRLGDDRRRAGAIHIARSTGVEPNPLRPLVAWAFLRVNSNSNRRPTGQTKRDVHRLTSINELVILSAREGEIVHLQLDSVEPNLSTMPIKLV